MKVCTDSCLFGAWVADLLEQGQINARTILDIGAGTGLLSLMAAQKSDAHIDAVEIDNAAFEEACENFSRSPWNPRLNASLADIKEFHGSILYDCIVSNPPFFGNDLRSPVRQKNMAKHHETLSYKDLLVAVSKHLHPAGCFAVLLPATRGDGFLAMAEEHGFFLHQKIAVKQTPAHDPFRHFLLFRTTPAPLSAYEWCIRSDNGDYSAEAMQLLKDYYL